MKKFTLSLFLYCTLLSAEENIFRNNTNETDPTSSFEHGKESNNLIPAKSDSLESFKEQENKEKAKQLMDLKVLPKTNALKPLDFSYGDTRRNAFRRANME
ncbi:hypothetical protein oki200_02800 [Helicobacter pylori]